MPKYFVSPEDIDMERSRIPVCGDDALHLISALRVRRGDHVTVCDGQCVDYNCEVDDINNKRLALKILTSSRVREPSLKVTLYQALPKSDKMEYIIQKCVEMGIFSIVPIYTENAVIGTMSGAKLSRYRKIAEAAAKQSMRGIIPNIAQPMALEQSITDSAGHGLVFAPYENECQTSLRDILSGHNLNDVGSAAFFIGSEGGFTNKEAEMFIHADIPRVSLGSRVLRTETAGFAVLTILMYACGDLDHKRG